MPHERLGPCSCRPRRPLIARLHLPCHPGLPLAAVYNPETRSSSHRAPRYRVSVDRPAGGLPHPSSLMIPRCREAPPRLPSQRVISFSPAIHHSRPDVRCRWLDALPRKAESSAEGVWRPIVHSGSRAHIHLPFDCIRVRVVRYPARTGRGWLQPVRDAILSGITPHTAALSLAIGVTGGLW